MPDPPLLPCLCITRSSGRKACSCGRSTSSSRSGTSSGTSRRAARRWLPRLGIHRDRDRARLARHRQVRRCGARPECFPDGTPMRMPDDDPLPASDRHRRAGARRDRLSGRAVAPRRLRWTIDAPGGAEQLARHQVREVEARDAASGSTGSAVLEVGALRSRFLLASEVTDAYACVPLAHIVECESDKRVVLDDAFIPTVLRFAGGQRGCRHS